MRPRGAIRPLRLARLALLRSRHDFWRGLLASLVLLPVLAYLGLWVLTIAFWVQLVGRAVAAAL